MGDTGSQTLGLVVGVLALGQMMNNGTGVATSDFILVFSPLLIPALDVMHVALFRLIGGRHPFHPDMTHIHHRLMRRGFNSRQVLVFILCMAVVFTLANMMLAPYMNVTLIFLLDVVIWCAFNSRVWLRVDGKVHAKLKRLNSTDLIKHV
jgi:UDP-N-acetylmuramyl pentapeptide phosphotransferase/UDP-N-acetylglucosamine-1-phosphate transferase